MIAADDAGHVETAWAKLNLALHVRRRRDDGYHEIETLFAFCADGDTLRATPADTLTLAIDGPQAQALGGTDAGGMGDGGDNLVLRAARALATQHGVRTGAALTLTKRLPVAAGLGGGSADAAAALRLLARLWALPDDPAALTAIARALGADVPACVRSLTAHGSGRGDDLAAAASIAAIPVLLVNPRIPLATAPVFAGWDGADRGALPGGGDSLAAALAGRNDLEIPAIALCPAIADVLALLRGQPGTRLARMSGSGATCFGLFDDARARDAADETVADAAPGWWRMATMLR